MSQQSIDFYLRQRKETVKRKAGVDESYNTNNKVRILEHKEHGFVQSSGLEYNELTPEIRNTTLKTVKLISSKKESLLADKKLAEGKVKTKGKAIVKLSFENVDMVHSDEDHTLKESSTRTDTKNSDGRKVKFIKKGALSPKKKPQGKNLDITAYLMKQNVPKQDVSVPDTSKPKTEPEETNVPLSELDKTNKQETELDKVVADRKALSLGDIKKCMSRSSRINELRNSISRLNKGFDKLKELNTSTNTSPDTSKLKGFKSIELLIPASPVKQSPMKLLGSPLTSPMKEVLMSPRKIGTSPIKSPIKIPAYDRLASLATPAPSLTLPHHYRWLGEVFKGIEQVCSMMYNRKESITFSKVKQAVQEMLRRNVTEKQIAQIKHLSPQMYSFTREKVKNFGTTSKREEYELVMKPNVINKSGCISDCMTPAIVLERQRSFYNLLLDSVKEHHSVFLTSLDPPMDIPRDKLKRWHPEFELECIPDVVEDSLPEAPNAEKFSTAQDVLTHFRQQFNCNTKMERALMRLAEAKARGLTSEEQKATGLKADGSETTNGDVKLTVENVNKSSSSSSVLTNPAFKGIPKALLEKVRARQAAKALESMTKSPAQVKDALMYQRLPDLARLVRHLFVTEKKSVLPFEIVLSKLDNSFRVKMCIDDLTRHVRLLSKELPAWLTFYEFRKTEFLKLVKDADMSKIMRQLGDLANKHSV